MLKVKVEEAREALFESGMRGAVYTGWDYKRGKRRKLMDSHHDRKFSSLTCSSSDQVNIDTFGSL